jgi:hypothetical protein
MLWEDLNLRLIATEIPVTCLEIKELKENLDLSIQDWLKMWQWKG